MIIDVIVIAKCVLLMKNVNPVSKSKEDKVIVALNIIMWHTMHNTKEKALAELESFDLVFSMQL